MLSLQGQESGVVDDILSGEALPTGTPEIISIAVPFRLEDAAPTSRPSYLASKFPISLCTVYKESNAESIATLRWALEQGRAVDIDIQADLNNTEKIWEDFEDLLTKATTDLDINTPIVLSNVLPPPKGLAHPIVKLMNHPAYRAYQTQTAALSLFPNVYVKFIPPSWDTSVPTTAGPSLLQPRVTELIASQTPITALPMVTPSSASPAWGLGGGRNDDLPESKQIDDWKRRIKMYLGPVLEAFGYSRIIFGSSPSPSASGKVGSSIPDWYEIARETLAELGSDQEAVDMVFGLNARKVYGSPPATAATPITA